MINYLELLKEFIKTDFKLRYKNSYLGIVWIILKPLASFAVIYLIWSNILVMDSNYKMSLLLGIMLMSFFNEGVMMGLSSLMSKAGIILKIKFPREIVVYSAVTISLFDFIFNMVVFAIFCIFTPIVMSPLGALLFILSVFCLYLLTLALSMLFSIMFIKFRDINNLMVVILQLLFWLTPIYYKLEMLPENLQNIVKYNPLTLMVTLARKGLITGNEVVLSDIKQILIAIVICFVLLLITNVYFKKGVSKIAEYF